MTTGISESIILGCIGIDLYITMPPLGNPILPGAAFAQLLARIL